MNFINEELQREWEELMIQYQHLKNEQLRQEIEALKRTVPFKNAPVGGNGIVDCPKIT